MIYFLLYIFLEIMVSVQIASFIGPLLTFAEVVGSAIVGIVLLANFRMAFSQNIIALMQQQMSLDDFEKQNVAMLLGAILLVVPGFLTDIIGLFLQFGAFGNLFARRMFHLKPRSPKGRYDNDQFNQGEESVIDVEIIEHSDSSKH